MLVPFKQTLNHQQLEAVESPAAGRLQIIAGPGTGKTKVLISRVAQLLLVDHLDPHSIIVTTFTKKAANEIVQRLTPLLKDTGIDANSLLTGTFHSICYRIIRKYGRLAGINNFQVADERDSTQILKDVVKNLKPNELEYLRVHNDEVFRNGEEGPYHGYNIKTLKRQISKLKASGISAAEYNTNKSLKYIYEQYHAKLRRQLLLDFDDCLVECYNIISKHPVLGFIQHVLVDEFQDTNEIQLKLMYEFARGDCKNGAYQHNVTVVGDPDQSIYGFRNAQVVNFTKMVEYYQQQTLPVTQIALKENYRSSKDILDLSATIMNQQQYSVARALHSQFQITIKPVYKALDSYKQEARWIAYQIVFLTALPRLFQYKDMAILVRLACQTRAIENELTKLKIPYGITRGKAFWERREVVAIVDYLRVIANPLDRIAYIRTLNLPKRGIGDKTLAVINDTLDAMDLLESDIYGGLEVVARELPPKVRSNIMEYLSMIDRSRQKLAGLEPHSESVSEFFDFVWETSGLKQCFIDETEHQNISEVRNQLMEYTPMEDQLPEYQEIQPLPSSNFISDFVASLGLYEHTENDNGNKVSIATVHGAKGLEWPVVFVPGLCEGTFPAHYAMHDEEKVDEERRCFYVATTRAKSLLYVSSYNAPHDISRFLQGTHRIFTEDPQCFISKSQLDDLYELRGVTSGGFDVEGFSKAYKAQLKPFLEEEISSIQTSNYKETVIKMGFSSAKTLQLNETIKSAMKRPYAASKRFKAPKSMEPSAKAPHYVVKKLVNTPRGKMAPPYIPNRSK